MRKNWLASHLSAADATVTSDGDDNDDDEVEGEAEAVPGDGADAAVCCREDSEALPGSMTS